MATAIVYSPEFLEHETGTHVENAGRLRSIMTQLEASGTLRQVKLIEPRAASVDQVAAVHTKSYVARIKAMAEAGGDFYDSETIVSPASYRVALRAAGGVIDAAEAVLKGEVQNAFALVRPPGHHATRERAMGFCIFNNVAIAAKHVRAAFGLKRIAIVDFDVHHGNGTQEAFESDPGVLYASTHQMPLYPGTGYPVDQGSGQAAGTKVNVAMPPGSGDEEYSQAYVQVIAPVLERFRPELVLVSAGYDAHWADQLASMQLTVSGFAAIVRTIKAAADVLCSGRMALTLEGGYDLNALAYSVNATIDVLRGAATINDPLGFHSKLQRPAGFDRTLKDVRRLNKLD